MDRKQNRQILPLARVLRKNMTKEEKHLWYDFLSQYPVRFFKQRILGKYIVDFYCSKAKLVIVLDGSQHYDDAGMLYDKERDEYLSRYGLCVIHISNLDVMKNFEGVCSYIDRVVKERM